jgi:hypothetical protein
MHFLNKAFPLICVCFLILSPVPAQAQVKADSDLIYKTRNMGGPRFGMTYVPGKGQLSEELEYHGMGRTISQFGWHFEHQVVPAGGGPSFLIEFIPMLAGVEYGKLIPNFTFAMGFRTPGGWELGMGPNLSFSQTVFDQTEARTSLLLAAGKSFNYGGVSVPVNLAFGTSPEGNRVSLIFGYAIGKSGSKKSEKIQAEPMPEKDYSLHRP